MVRIDIETLPLSLREALQDNDEPVLFERDGRVVAEVRRVAEAADTKQTTGARLRPMGLAKGLFTVPDDFDKPLPDDILDLFEGRGEDIMTGEDIKVEDKTAESK